MQTVFKYTMSLVYELELFHTQGIDKLFAHYTYNIRAVTPHNNSKVKKKNKKNF